MVRIVGDPPPAGAIIRAAMLEELRSFGDTDTANAEAFELLNKYRFRYHHTKLQWMVWNGLAWAPDLDGEAERAAIDTARWRRSALFRELSGELDASDKQKFKDDYSAVTDGESFHGIRATLEVAKNLRSFATVARHYDRDPFLLTCGNGTLDLRTGKLRPAWPEDLITQATDICYYELRRCPRWVLFLNEVFAGDQDLIAFIQRAVGYSLTGDTREQCMFILHGNGANGKTTFLETIRMLVGPHAVTTPFETFTNQRNAGNARYDLAALADARLVLASEAGQDAGFNEAVVKQITGQDTIACRNPYERFFEYRPQFKIWVATNYKPTIRGADDAIWRRIRLIPFNQQFKGTKRDPDLWEKLKAELPGILAWAVRGCLYWQSDGLGRPKTMVTATLDYRRESDQVGRFVSECCSVGPEFSVSGSQLYDAYTQFCQRQGEKPLPNNIFAAEIAKRNFAKKRTNRAWVYQGVGLRVER